MLQISFRTTALLAGGLALVLNAAAARKPNIVFVLADDLGWTGLGCYGNTFHETPNLDRMAKEGLRFTQAYAAAPVCSPYRAALLTGLHPARLGITDYLRPDSANHLPAGLTTLPESLRDHGYTTGMIGKWHLTGYRAHGAEFETRPADHGFDWSFGSELKGIGNGANTWPYVFRTQGVRWADIPENRLGENENLTDRLNLEAVDFIERHQDRPFFLYLSHYAPHSILNGRPDLAAKYRARHEPGQSGRENCHLCADAGLGKGDPGHHWSVTHNPHLAAMVEGIDEGIGKIRAKLAELKLLENTIIIFTSDNGGETNVTTNAPLRGGKSDLYEGGIRVPLIVQWPAQIPAGGISHAVTANTDFFPTLAAAAGIKPQSERDGISLLDHWKHPAAPFGRDAIHWHYPLDHPHFLGGFSGGAIREGDWKLVEKFATDETELYRLNEDPSERLDLSGQQPDRVRELKAKLAAWRESVSARTPSAPLLTEPRQLYFSDHFSGPVSQRLWFNGDWSAENGILQRVDSGTDNTRIFLQDAAYREALIRFDFQLQKSRDIRMLTGSHGHYNSVVHIRPDHFFVETAKDESGPYFSYRHGECAYNFDPDRWYTMTVEILGNQMIAHIDREHIAHATHPILEKDRTYFAFQVDDQPAAIDNVQIFTVRPHPDLGANLEHIKSVAANHPVSKSPKEEYGIRKTNAHEWLFQRHPAYRALVEDLDRLDELKQRRFPAAFSSTKETKKSVLSLRKRLSLEDSAYRELLHATHRANRALDTYLLAQKPAVADYPDSRRKAALEGLRRAHRDTAAYRELLAVGDAAQARLEAAYPQAFVTEDAIKTARTAEQQRLKEDPEYRQLQKDRATAYRAQQDYLFANDERLNELRRLLDAKP